MCHALLDSGTYEMRVVETLVTTTRATGKPLIRLTLRPVSSHRCHHTDVTMNLVITPENEWAMAYFRRCVEVFGVKFDLRFSLSEIAGDLIDRVARVGVGQRDYQGRTYNEVKHVWPCRFLPVMTRRELNLMDTA